MSTPRKEVSRSPAASELLRRQLDQRLVGQTVMNAPRGGWIRTIRQSLGMTMQQLGRRLGISQQSVAELEERERNEGISVAKLRRAADALGCDVSITFVPRQPLESAVREQAFGKVKEERNRLVHTMRLEGQEEGVSGALDENRAVDRWLSKHTRRLWD